MTVVLLYTGIADLFKLQTFLKQVVNWKNLGLALGLLYPTLNKIEKEQHDRVDDCMREMLAAWLQQQDNVSQHGIPSWTVLQTVLREIGENELANEITTWWWVGGEYMCLCVHVHTVLLLVWVTTSFQIIIPTGCHIWRYLLFDEYQTVYLCCDFELISFFVSYVCNFSLSYLFDFC